MATMLSEQDCQIHNERTKSFAIKERVISVYHEFLFNIWVAELRIPLQVGFRLSMFWSLSSEDNEPLTAASISRIIDLLNNGTISKTIPDVQKLEIAINTIS